MYQLDIANNTSEAGETRMNNLHYDLEWLDILQNTCHRTKTARANLVDPNPEEINMTDGDVDAIRRSLTDKLGDHIY